MLKAMEDIFDLFTCIYLEIERIIFHISKMIGFITSRRMNLHLPSPLYPVSHNTAPPEGLIP
jgi:hypothetical protein